MASHIKYKTIPNGGTFSFDGDTHYMIGAVSADVTVSINMRNDGDVSDDFYDMEEIIPARKVKVINNLLPAGATLKFTGGNVKIIYWNQ